MAWSTPKTAVTFETVTASDWNTYVRDNLLETEAAKMIEAGTWVVSSGSNAIVPRKPASASLNLQEDRNSTTYGDLTTPGPSVTVTTGGNALVILSAAFWNLRAGNKSHISYAVSGATTVSPSDTRSMRWEQDTIEVQQCCYINLHTDLTPGENTFTMKYRHSDEGSGGDPSIRATRRHIMVIPF